MYSRLVGHTEQVEYLKQLRSRQLLSNAYIFAGPQSIGKKMAAMEFIKSFLCTAIAEDRKIDPCDQCGQCLRVAAGKHENVMLVSPDGGSIPVERSRETVRFLSFRSDSYRFVLIDDAHLASEEAQNSLLKIIEEPPGRSSIILITHSIALLLETVRSRCMVIHFTSLNKEQMMSLIRERVKENKVPSSGVELVCFLSDGNLGRAFDFAHRFNEIEAEVNLILEKLERKDFNYLVDSYAKGKSAAESRERARFLFKIMILRSRGLVERGDTLSTEAIFEGLKALDDNANVPLAVEETLLRANR
jgi:DNA polymerase-3 subunit delta'